MEQPPPLKCSCAHCGQIIEYEPAKAGQTVECPKCREKSQLPPLEKPRASGSPSLYEPESLPPKACPECGAPLHPADRECRVCARRRGWKRAALIGVPAIAVVALAIAAALLLAHRLARQRPQPASENPPTESPKEIPKPKVKTPKSLSDLKVGEFTLKKTRGEEVNFAAGDIENDSENLFRRLKVNLDLLDAQGAKIGAVNEVITELPPHGVWHVMARITEPKTVSIRFSGLSEEP
jgi:hypothetical protein